MSRSWPVAQAGSQHPLSGTQRGSERGWVARTASTSAHLGALGGNAVTVRGASHGLSYGYPKATTNSSRQPPSKDDDQQVERYPHSAARRFFARPGGAPASAPLIAAKLFHGAADAAVPVAGAAPSGYSAPRAAPRTARA